ncbi:hypothetical protein GUITHDRAFT_165425 [Guillardia theta CCMP2712]|uniref:Glycosyl transferase family 1 domain-containing protein n=1 Tax=Guillardia theta (strain CCMP2712) TaxID=905079 RepID=L1IN76_GUITC|nr:hypothetical protein GUITHDRAFT_165425 [Guillardia theta CCMP2712]EKX37718.1 hypothetical protein GUITHDRAFT_165425 [Guillardia theta CCMP2712]|eukprot:XP_005824698.1 hypothetical protein GUITHDRAFT_165425 [Guillardia theta CCMP2712]
MAYHRMRATEHDKFMPRSIAGEWKKLGCDKKLKEGSWGSEEEEEDKLKKKKAKLSRLAHGDQSAAMLTRYPKLYGKQAEELVASNWDDFANGSLAAGAEYRPLPPDLIIKVLTFARPSSLLRLLRSLDLANYSPDRADLEIWIDGPSGGSRDEERKKTLQVAEEFSWRHGKKTLEVRDKNVGLVGQWLGCWQPEEGARLFESIVVIFEDDMEVSPVYWRWLKSMWPRYRRALARRQDLIGISLQTQHLVASDGRDNLRIDNEYEPFLYKVPGSWGFSPHPRTWRLFLRWQQAKSATGYEPDDLKFRGGDVITSKWWKDIKRSGKSPRMWTAWCMRFMEDEGLFGMYPNLPGRRAFTATWSEPGEHDAGHMGGRLSGPLQRVWDATCEKFPESPWRIDFDGSRITSPPPPLRPRQCDLRGVNVIFDGYIYHLTNGRLDGGVAKMWHEIVPFMIKAVTQHGGDFTHCAYSDHVLFSGVKNLNCHSLQRVKELPGEHKVLFSSYYQGSPDACFIHMVYDHIPERTGMDAGPGSEYWPRIDNLRHAGGFLSISKSTTDDLCELYGMCERKLVATSDNRAAPIFKPASKEEEEDFRARYDLRKPYILIVGKRYGYKNYDVFWEGLEAMPQSFRSKYMVLLVGLPEEKDHGIEVKDVKMIPEKDMPTLYSASAVFVYTSSYEGFGMPPVEAAACGAQLILGPFHRHRMHQVFGDLAQYAETSEEMVAALTNIDTGRVPASSALVDRAKLYGTDPRHGWNEVAKDYLEYMIHGPFRTHTLGGRNCQPLVLDPDDCRFETTPHGLKLAS